MDPNANPMTKATQSEADLVNAAPHSIPEKTPPRSRRIARATDDPRLGGHIGRRRSERQSSHREENGMATVLQTRKIIIDEGGPLAQNQEWFAANPVDQIRNIVSEL